MTPLGKPRTSAPQPTPGTGFPTAAPLHDLALVVHGFLLDRTFVLQWKRGTARWPGLFRKLAV
jgi:hypothetical protein